MTRKTDPRDLDHCIEVYHSGKTLAQAGAERGVSASALSRELKRRGIKARSRRIELPSDEIIHAYEGGTTELALSLQHGVSRNVIRRVLEEGGAHVRSMSEASLLRWEQMTPEERAHTVAAAHESSVGRVPSEREMVRRAQTREAKGWTGRTSENERRLDRWLRERGLDPIREQAIGRNNIDFGLRPVAVELMGGSWHQQRA